MNWVQIVALVFGSVLGGQWLITLITAKSQRKKAKAEAEGSEIDNAKKLLEMMEDISKTRAEADAKQIAVLKELAEQRAESDSKQISSLNTKIEEFETMFNSFKKTVERLTKAINKAKECPGVENCIVLKDLKDKNS